MSELSGNAEPQLGIAGEEAKLGLGVPGKSVPGWHSRGYLPHYDSTSVHQTITFRLADSLPQVKLRQLEDELKILADNKRDITRRTRIQEWLDAGMGCGALRHPDMASLMQETLWKFHGERYGLVAWCIMPNHVHVLIAAKLLEEISVYADRLVLWNPGQLPPDWTLARLLGKHPSSPYNPLLANAFFLSGYIESWGRGIEKIANECKEHGIEPPDYDSGMSGLMLTFHASPAYLALINPKPAGPGSGEITKEAGGKTGVETRAETGVKTPGRILQLLEKNPEMTLAQVAMTIGKSVSAVELASSKLVKAGRLVREGPKKGGHWRVLK